MTDSTRRALLAALGAATTAGCLGGVVGDDVPSGDTPAPDHSVTLSNDDDEPATVRIRVFRDATDETVFEETVAVQADGETEPYNLKEADPDGVESFTVCATRVASETSTTAADSTTSGEPQGNCATVKTNECFGNVIVSVTDDGSVQVFYSIC